MLRAVVSAVLALLAILPTAASAAAPAAPALVRDLDPRPLGAAPLPSQFFRAGPRTVFVRQDSSLLDTGELWSTDGTAAGTGRLRAFPAHLRILGSTGSVVLFATPALVNSAYTEPSRLWRTDGTREGTFALGTVLGADLTSTDPMQSPALVFRNVLLFSGCTPGGGCELWRSDGTPEGTRRLREIVPGPGGSAPYAFTAFAGRAWFFAEDAHGAGLWQTDGTSRGTQEVLGLPPFASPRHLFVQGSQLYFTEGAGCAQYCRGGASVDLGRHRRRHPPRAPLRSHPRRRRAAGDLSRFRPRGPRRLRGSPGKRGISSSGSPIRRRAPPTPDPRRAVTQRGIPPFRGRGGGGRAPRLHGRRPPVDEPRHLRRHPAPRRLPARMRLSRRRSGARCRPIPAGSLPGLQRGGRRRSVDDRRHGSRHPQGDRAVPLPLRAAARRNPPRQGFLLSRRSALGDRRHPGGDPGPGRPPRHVLRLLHAAADLRGRRPDLLPGRLRHGRH